MTHRHKCPYCDRTFANSKLPLLREHLQAEHPSESPMSCTVCSRVFRGVRELHVHAGYTDATLGEKLVQAHCCTAKHCRRWFCSREGRIEHERTCKHRRTEAQNPDKQNVKEDANMVETVKKSEHRQLFRAALEEDRVKDFVPMAGYSSNTALQREQPALTTDNNDDSYKQKPRHKKKGKKKSRPTPNYAEASTFAINSTARTDTPPSQAAGTLISMGRVVDLDNYFYGISNEPRYGMYRWEDCGYCGRCMDDLYPESHQETYYEEW
ncbi:hypothetical protein PMIN06_008856 [Paraphaeosphaeria minitans]|uniref:C2H2-type domain-containing protein n=1 Tax=Paraphaeosphaeria minitans TaxID=565426 RepID=A0A9P6GQF1_9PLEO|nr:hypothetical protein PMIN01_02576 [Paraphaeosphaeria minitans]